MDHRNRHKTSPSTSRRLWVALLGGALLLGAGGTAHASKLEDALDRVSSRGGAFTQYDDKQFETATRHGYTGGGMSMRFAQKRYSLVNVTPPSIEAGCSGIDVHFGGFSYIDGEEIQEMLKNISQGVVGYAFQLALKQYCGLCGDVLEFMQRMSQMANKLANDSCQVAEDMVAGFPDPGQMGANAWCSTAGPNEGDSGDWISASQDTCETAKESRQELQKLLDGSGTKGDEYDTAKIHGNETWLALQAAGLAPNSLSDGDDELRYFAELMMTWMGTTVRGQKMGGAVTDSRYSLFSDAETFLNVFMCGTNDSVSDAGGLDSVGQSVQQEVASFCKDKLGEDNDLQVLRCPDDDLDSCANPKVKPLSSMDLGFGFMGMVADELARAAENAKNGDPLTDKQKALVAAAPFPLYQVVNVTTVYPQVGARMLADNATILAYMISIRYVKDMLESARQRDNGEMVSVKVMDELAQAEDSLRDDIDDVAKEINTMGQVQERIMSQVNQINRATLDRMNSLGLSGVEFARDMAGRQ